MLGSLLVAGGVLVLGQEQDKVGGGFSNAESFVGNISLFNIWDRKLSAKAITDMADSCTEYDGSLKAWPDFLAGIHGDVIRTESNFCTCRFSDISNIIKYIHYLLICFKFVSSIKEHNYAL